ncbi:MAG: COG1470 family protein [Candidatus Bipolaricaulia bacterium]
MARLKLRSALFFLIGGLALALILALAMVLKVVPLALRGPSQALKLEITPLKPRITAAPGEFITQVFILSYRTDSKGKGAARLALELALTAPSGWQVLGLDEASPFELGLGESKRLFLTLGVPHLAPPREYRLSLQAGPSTGSSPSPGFASFIVEVKAAAAPRLEPRSPRAEVEPEPEKDRAVSLAFELSNQGNVRGAFALLAHLPRGWEAIYPERLELGPGERREIEATVTIPREAPPGVEEFILKAVAQDYGYEAEAKVKVTVLPH